MGKKLNRTLDQVAPEKRTKIAERAQLRAALKDAVPDPIRITPLSESLIERAVKATGESWFPTATKYRTTFRSNAIAQFMGMTAVRLWRGCRPPGSASVNSS